MCELGSLLARALELAPVGLSQQFDLSLFPTPAGVVLLSWNPQRMERMPTSYGNMDEDDLELDGSNHSRISTNRTHGTCS